MGRPEPYAQEGFRLPFIEEAGDMFILHEHELSHVDEDAQLFSGHSSDELADHHGGLGGCPTKEHLDQL